jgi:A/G-specific adenine glycosylase
MELGALICTPRRPQCQQCPLKRHCVAFKEDRTESLPHLGKRPSATVRRFLAFAIESKGRFLVQQRPAGGVNAQLWEFPNAEVGARGSDPLAVYAELRGLAPAEGNPESLQPLCTVKHSITRYRITLEAFLVRLQKNAGNPGGDWKTPAQMQKLAFTAAHKKLASAAAQSILLDR